MPKAPPLRAITTQDRLFNELGVAIGAEHCQNIDSGLVNRVNDHVMWKLWSHHRTSI